MDFHGSTARVGEEGVNAFPFERLHQNVRTLARGVSKAVNPLHRGFRCEGRCGITASCFELLKKLGRKSWEMCERVRNEEAKLRRSKEKRAAAATDEAGYVPLHCSHGNHGRGWRWDAESRCESCISVKIMPKSKFKT